MADGDKRSDAQRERDRELDDFWDISRLLPDKPRRQAPLPRRSTPPGGVEIELPMPENGAKPLPAADPGTADISAPVRDVPLPPHPADGADAGGSLLGRTHYVPPHTAGEEKNGTPELSYDADGVLLHRVEVYVWRSDYRYFDQFVQDAAAYAARHAPAEQPAREPFFSFFPQYVQMGRRQETWYLWWREQVRHGVFPDTDYAYILLYVFELINQPLPPVAEDRGEAGTVCRTLASVWMAYRHRYPQLDHYMCEWLCDFCLIHRLGVPADILSPALDDIVQISRMKEFYLSAAVGGKGTDAPDLAGARILLRHCCQYDYRKSKFAGGENAALFDRIIPGAVAAVLPLLLRQDGKPPLITMQDSTVTRDAYTGALCAYRNKRRLVVSYTSFSRSHELRFLIGDMVKHTENRLRRYIGVRSRLSVMTLPVCVREALDAYLDPLLPAPIAAPKPKAEPPRPAYEALYDLPVKPVSQEDAARIEQASWETTRILTEAFGTAEETAENAPDVRESDAASPAVDECATETTAVAAAAATAAATAAAEAVAEPADGTPLVPGEPELADFLRLALAGDGAGQRALAARLRVLPDALADRINEWAVGSNIGDIILEETDGGYAVMEDYRTAVTALLQQA